MANSTGKWLIAGQQPFDDAMAQASVGYIRYRQAISRHHVPEQHPRMCRRLVPAASGRVSDGVLERLQSRSKFRSPAHHDISVS
jgi:hypothetical protein